MQSKKSPAIAQKIRSEMARDPKRTGVILGISVVMIFLLLRMEFTGPAAATASFVRRPPAVTSDAQPQHPREASSNALLDWLAQPRRQLVRNLFALNLRYYSRASDHIVSEDSLEDAGKSRIDAADRTKDRQIPPKDLQNQASKLNLQATVLGTAATDQAADAKRVSTNINLADSQLAVNESGSIELHATNAPIVQLLHMLSRKTGKNIVASDGVTGDITADLYNLNLNQTLDAVLMTNSCVYRETNNVIYVFTRKELTDPDNAARLKSLDCERLAKSACENAEAELNRPHPDTNIALWHLDIAIDLDPNFQEAIALRERVSGKRVIDSDSSTIREFVSRSVSGSANLPPAVHDGGKP